MSKNKKIHHCAVFKPRTKNDDNAELSNSMIISARKTGQLNLSSRGLFTGMFKHIRMLRQCIVPLMHVCLHSKFFSNCYNLYMMVLKIRNQEITKFVWNR
ncbi:hypothetical protein KPH14_002583 [Odynerus spinipes]|uniref:Uncharacterized protein n=1 Tax=Odynerus spinipes TaxID=1348599 RepID=A0AAD9REJ9_9HYME|nr:hypothetical protein KPH14_002583 [Odynerus spinipes]